MLAIPDRLAVDVADAQALKAQAARGDRAALEQAARQFEALLVTQMLKSMRQTRFSTEDDAMNGGQAMALYRDLLDQQWASQMSKGRGLGFADMMLRALERQTGSPTPTQAPEQATAATGAGAARLAAETQPSAAAVAVPIHSAADFIKRMIPHAQAAARATGLAEEFILGHAALESGWGRHEIRDAGERNSHNLFGIKAGSRWEGAVAETLTTEYRGGLPLKLSQRFRAYADYDAAFADYARLLQARFAQALQAGTDAAAFSKGLAAAGYATDPAYADKLQAVIARVRQLVVQAGTQVGAQA